MGDERHRRTFSPFEGANDSSGKVNRKIWNLQRALEEFEKQFITEALKHNLGHRGKTAAMLGINRKTLYTKLKKYGMI